MKTPDSKTITNSKGILVLPFLTSIFGLTTGISLGFGLLTVEKNISTSNIGVANIDIDRGERQEAASQLESNPSDINETINEKSSNELVDELNAINLREDIEPKKVISQAGQEEENILEEKDEFDKFLGKIKTEKVSKIKLNSKRLFDLSNEPVNVEVPQKSAALKKINTVNSKKSRSEKIYTPTQKQNLVNFIAGVIVVYHPEIEDVGEVSSEIIDQSLEFGLDPLYVASVISVESAFFSTAKSKAGAKGLMQIMPATFKGLVQQNEKRKISGAEKSKMIVDIDENLKYGVIYLKQLEEKYKGNKVHTLAAYNWGPGNVDSALNKNRNIPKEVNKYAAKILNRTYLWNTHFKNCEDTVSHVG